MASTNTADGNKVLNLLTQITYWPLYFILLFPIHVVIQTILYLSKHSIEAPFRMLFSYKYLYFCTPKERFKLFIRNSWILTPSDFLPWMKSKREYNSDHTVERRSMPHNWDEIRSKTYSDDNYTCQCCGVMSGPHGGNVELHADHIMPVSRRGNDDYENLRTLCKMCHQARHCRFFD